MAVERYFAGAREITDFAIKGLGRCWVMPKAVSATPVFAAMVVHSRSSWLMMDPSVKTAIPHGIVRGLLSYIA